MLARGDGDPERHVADESGSIQLSAGAWTVVGWQETFAAISAERVVVAPDTTTTLWLVRGADLRVEVVDELDHPVEAAAVEWRPDEGRVGAGFTFRTLPAQRLVHTDRHGIATFESFPTPWAGRVLVSCRGFFPSQQTVPSAARTDVTTVTIALRSTPADMGYGLRCVDHDGTPLQGVRARADLVMNDWPDAAEIDLGATDSLGCLSFDDWITGAYAIHFDGPVCPSFWRLFEGALKAHGCVDVVVARYVEGTLTLIPNERAGSVWMSVSGAPEPAGSYRSSFSGPLTRIQVDGDGRSATSLPEWMRADILCYDDELHLWHGAVVTESGRWEGTLRSSSEAFEVITLVPHFGEIATVTVTSASLGDAVTVAALEREGQTVRLELPPRVHGLQVRSVDGQCVTVSRQNRPLESVVDVFFEPTGTAALELVDEQGGPVTDVRVIMKRRQPSLRSASSGGAWLQSPASGFRAEPDGLGRVHLALPCGDYQPVAMQLPWRESPNPEIVPITPATIMVASGPAGAPVQVVIPRPRAISLRIQVDSLADVPRRWTIRDTRSPQPGTVFQGDHAEFWATDQAIELELADEKGRAIGQVRVPPGKTSWSGAVRL